MKDNLTACPLDCYDACEIVYDNAIKAYRGGHTQGFLCPHLNHFEENERIEKPRYNSKEISMQEAIDILGDILKKSHNRSVLHYRGTGNFGLMQEVGDHFFASYGAMLSEGSLCDGAGEAGIIEGRGSNKNMPFSEIAKSDVVIFWGRNPHTTSSHLLPLIKDKKIIVIDPIRTKIADMADVYIQIKPHTDLYLAMLLSRFLYINESINEEYIEKYGSEFEDFYELTQTIRIKAHLDDMNVTLGDIGSILELVIDKKVAIVCGVGIQKYKDGADVLRAIDAFATSLGLFGKEGCGVSYLGDSKESIKSPFKTDAKRVSKVNTPFSKFDTVFIQGANPLSQMPNTTRVENELQNVENIIYFGLYENETSKMANLVIPAKTFLEKNDIRTSYGHNAMMVMNKQIQSDIGISEYELFKILCEKFDLEIESEEYYIEYFKNHSVKKIDGSFVVENREDIPYKDGFDTDDGEFVFLDEYEPKAVDVEGSFYLLTPKNHISLNSQFKRDKYVYLHSSLGYKDGDKVEIKSKDGSVILSVKNNDRLREDTILIFSGTPGVNNLTSSEHAYGSKSAIYQENMVEINSHI
jgi:anaerobic selenocysteine-containing dehydrogenase